MEIGKLIDSYLEQEGDRSNLSEKFGDLDLSGLDSKLSI